MAYLVGVKNGIVPCGNPGLFPHSYRDKARIRALAKELQKQHGLDHIYDVPTLSLEMCQMNAEELAQKVKETGTCII